MRRLLSFLLSIVAFSVVAGAADWNIVINVTQGADRVDAVIGSGYSPSPTDSKVELVNGENNVTIPGGSSLFITPLYSDDIVSFTDRDGDKISNYSGYFEIYASSYGSPYSPYTLSVYDAESYRSKSVNVIMDDCSLVTIVRGDGTEFEPEESTITIPYNPENESKLTIEPRSYSGKLYKVTADGVDVPKSSSSFTVNLVDNSGSEPAYVENINVTANFPEDLTFKTTIILDGPAEMISSIKINDSPVASLADCLGENGFEAKPADKITIAFDVNHKIESIYDNNKYSYPYGQYTIDGIDCDHEIIITGRAYEIFDVKFNVTGGEGVVASMGSTTIDFTDGENVKKFSEKNNYVTFRPASGYQFSVFTDGETDYLSLSDWTYYGSVYLSLAPGQEYTIVAEKIRRDNQIVIYYDDYTPYELSYFETKFNNYSDYAYKISTGYNTINFRDEDGYFSVFASGSYEGFYAYKNDAPIALDREGAKYFEDYAVAHNDVYKVFFVTDPGTHTVTFDIANNALAGYAVIKDIICDVDPSAPVKAVGPTRFTIAPASRADNGLEVIVGGQTVNEVNGAYTFETSADTTVTVKAKGEPSGVENVLSDENAAADVYNLQGIRVARSATIAEINALPAGVYIINGTKISVK